LTQDNKFIRSLTENAKRGNNAALEQLFEMSLGKIYALSFLLTGDKPSADLITINTFINAWDFTDTIDEDITFVEWIKDITVYVALHELKKQDKPDEPKKLENDELIEKFPSSSVVKEYLKLSDTNKFILTLNFIENYSADAIAKMLNIRANDIAQRITDSIKAITSGSEDNQSIDTVLEKLENLPNEIIPEKTLLKFALNKIYDMKIEDWEKEEKKRLKEEILKYRKETKENKAEHKIESVKIKKEIPKLHFNKKFLHYPIIIAVLVMVFLYLFSITAPWTIVIKSGSPQLNDQIIAGNTEINNGDILQTNDFSVATLELLDVGTIEVLESTTIERLGGSYSAKLIRGKIIVNTDGAEDFLHVEISQAAIIEFNLGSNYILQTDGGGNSTIELIDGWLQLISGETEFIFPGGYDLKILKGSGAGLPFHNSSTSEFINLLEEYLFGRKSDNTLNVIIESSSAKDGITLWNLFRIVKPGQRQAVYDKLYELFPHPDEINREDILTLDEDMLYVWLEEIEWEM
jgi:DNA-directed RNA polymerase specialized sigma24 family protein